MAYCFLGVRSISDWMLWEDRCLDFIMSYALFVCVGLSLLRARGLATKSANCSPAELHFLSAIIGVKL